MQFAESSVPTERLLIALRPVEKANLSPAERERAERERLILEDRLRRQAPIGFGLPPSFVARSVPIDLTSYFRAGHAVATMGFGLLGCLLAPLALMAAKSKDANSGVSK